MSNAVVQGMIKASILKEALASCQMEGIGLDLTLEDLYLAELGYCKSKKKLQQIKECGIDVKVAHKNETESK